MYCVTTQHEYVLNGWQIFQKCTNSIFVKYLVLPMTDDSINYGLGLYIPNGCTSCM